MDVASKDTEVGEQVDTFQTLLAPKVRVPQKGLEIFFEINCWLVVIKDTPYMAGDKVQREIKGC